MSASRGTLSIALALVIAIPAAAQQRPAPAAPAATAAAPALVRSAPISNVTYDVTFDSATASTRSLRVAMSFDAGGGAGPVLL